MLLLEEAQQRIIAAAKPLAGETIPLAAAAGRILAERILASIDLPVFDNSAMDGYALKAQDVNQASATNPIRLRVQGRVAAGESFPEELSAGACVRLFTGSPLPRGADAVVMQEDTRRDAVQAETVLVLEPVKPWENVRFQGEDVKRGRMLAETGDLLNAGRIGLLAATGCAAVKVGRQPRVALIATGNELREGGQALAPGQIYESNRASLAALLGQIGARSQVFPPLRDDLDETRAVLERALTECDAVVTSGGVSVGELDFVKDAFQQMGGQMEFWKVAIKPGKPFVFGQWRGKLWFGLPGNPVSALVTFLLLVRPALLKMQGAANLHLPAHPGTLAERLVNQGDRRHFMRVLVDDTGRVHPAGVQASHILHSLALANGLVDVPPQTTLAAGETVSVLRWS